MTELLQQAFEQAAKLPQTQQDTFARFLLAELDSERRWDELLNRPESEDLLGGWPTRPWRRTARDERSLWTRKYCRRAFLYAAGRTPRPLIR